MTQDQAVDVQEKDSITATTTQETNCVIKESENKNTVNSLSESNAANVANDSIDCLETKNETELDDVKASRQSRELKSILALSKEANLDTNIVHKRKSVEPNKTQQPKSEIQKGSSSVSESPQTKRAMRSQNPEFLIKQQKFLSKIVSHGGESPPELSDNDEKKDVKSVTQKALKKKGTNVETTSVEEPPKLKNLKIDPVKNKDIFCWRCHKVDVNISCETCPRSYHTKCLKQAIVNSHRWICPECVAIMKAESTKERSPAMKDMSLEHLCGLLKFALKRMIQVTGSEPFLHPVSEKDFPEYKNYIIQPMDLTRLGKSIKENLYGSTQAFEADAKWILHNSVIFNTAQAKLTTIAKSIMKVCKQEMSEIENCASCYLNANTKKDCWFVEVCPKPHLLVWAKLKGFPYWPAKAMRTNSLGMVDVRFFGAHDRAWVPDKECFLYSLKDPNCNKQKRNDIIECIKELDIHIENLKKVYGEFCYAPYRTPLEINKDQLQILLPQYNPDNFIGMIKKKEDFDEKNSDTQNSSNLSSFTTSLSSLDNLTKDQNFLKENEGDKTFEGYGSEEDDLEPKLDENRRKKMAEKRIDDNDGTTTETSKEDEDFETQINSTSINDKCYKNRTAEMGGEFSNTTGKLKITNKQYFPDELSKKRSLTEECLSEVPLKQPRRNSDLSVKSDSSRISNISDKINHIDISENMEISLGNSDRGNISISEVISSDISESSSKSDSLDNCTENRRKPVVQLHISGDENKEFMISPQNKVSIVDRLMQKLIQNTDNVGEVESSAADKRNKDIEKNNFKENISDDSHIVKLNQRLTEKLVVKDSISGAKHSENTDFSTKYQESNVDLEGKGENSPINSINKEKTKVPAPKHSRSKSVDFSEGRILERKLNTKVSKKSDSRQVIRSSKTILNKEDNNVNQSKFDEETPRTLSKDVNEVTQKSSEIIQRDIISVDNEMKNASQSKSNESVIEQEAIKPIFPRLSQSETNITNRKLEEIVMNSKIIANPNDSDEDDIFEETEPIEEISASRINENFFKDVIHSSLNVTKPLIASSAENNSSSENIQDIDKGEKIKTATPVFADSNKVNKKRKLDPENEQDQPQKKPLKLVNIKQLQSKITTALDSSSELQNKINEAFIQKTKPLDQLSETSKFKGNLQKTNVPKLNETSQKSVETTKEKIIDKEKETCYQPKITEKPVQKAHDKLESSGETLQTSRNETMQKSDVVCALDSQNHSLNSSSSKENYIHKTINSSIELDSITIKSEPSSEEEMSDSEYMEAKRKYMSALNISEKDKITEVFKTNEIRTRSRTEERSKLLNPIKSNKEENRFQSSEKGSKTDMLTKTVEQKCGLQIVDNVSRVINSVASYNAEHEGEGVNPTSVERKKEIPAKALATYQKQRARKSFPSPSITTSIQNAHLISKSEAIKTTKNATTLNTCINITTVATTSNTSTSPTKSILNSRLLDTTTTTSNVTITTGIVLVPQQSVMNTLAILPPNQPLTYNQSIGSPVISMIQQPLNTATIPSSVSFQPNTNQNSTISINRNSTLETDESQNYIPQSGTLKFSSVPCNTVTNTSSVILPVMLNTSVSNPKTTPRIVNPLPSLVPLSATTSSNIDNSNVANVNETTTSDAHCEEFDFLTGVIPEKLSRAVGEIMSRGIPKLKPKPPGPLSTQFQEGLPSSAGPVTSKINSISHRLTDYLRGMLIELLNELGSSETPEAEIVKLKLENEELRHKHAEEILEIKKNIGFILRDIQKSIIEERTKIVEETRAACEAETIKRVEEAKSKQWCANCFKEAQFYCCWNTSYCDYPCQQKHWLKHMSKCTQNQQQSQNGANGIQSPRLPNQAIMLRPANPVNRFHGKSLIAKPTKVYVNRGNLKAGQHNIIKTSSNNKITLVESSPGNYELLGSGSISVGGKLITTSAMAPKSQKGNMINMSTPSSSFTVNSVPKLSSSSSSQLKQPSSSKGYSLYSEDSD